MKNEGPETLRAVAEAFVREVLPATLRFPEEKRPVEVRIVVEAVVAVNLPVRLVVPVTEKLPEAKRSVAVRTDVEALARVVLPVTLSVPVIAELPPIVSLPVVKNDPAVKTVEEALPSIV